MKKLGITYLIKRAEETTESYIELPCGGKFSLLAFGENMGIGRPILQNVIYEITVLQGYAFDSVEIETMKIIDN